MAPAPPPARLAWERGITLVVGTHDLTLAGMSRRTVELVDGALNG